MSRGLGDVYKRQEQEFLPDTLAGTKFYEPNTGNATEAKIAERMRELWRDKYK